MFMVGDGYHSCRPAIKAAITEDDGVNDRSRQFIAVGTASTNGSISASKQRPSGRSIM